MMSINRRSLAGVLATATLVAVAVTAYGTQATGHGRGVSDPMSAVSYDRAGVGGRKGCEVQSWPYIAPECLAASDNGADHAKVIRRLL
ncbi:hypothetical protein SAMN02745157_1591 [Kaistia soli DSM 19436]|uniref:Porin n=1 Tax=Kaistia soli DSM 19436 TaxID=1122133 RepID=A0A1M4YQT7_9HYPH|nr:hypothetical protein [Kaistia soli]SHF08081.1 hypothetical protein SAMN02745157_1591 [Kaistia soli DSM 19436]